MSPKTTISGVLGAVAVFKGFFLSFDFASCDDSNDVFSAAFDAVNALNDCALSNETRAEFVDALKITALRYGAAVDVLNKQRDELQQKERDAERKKRRSDALKLALVLIVYLACAVPIAYFGWRALWILLPAAAFDWRLSGDSSIFIALTKFFRKSDK